MSTENESVEQNDLIADAILNADSRPSEPVDEPASAPDTRDDEPTEQELILGKFKSTDDVVEGYKNLEAHSTQVSQQLKELEARLAEYEQAMYEEPKQQTQWGMPFDGTPQNEEQLVGWAEKDPGAAAQWAIANNEIVPAETVNALWEHWFTSKPTEAMAWYTQQQTQTVAQQYEQRIAELQSMVEPLRDQQTQSMFENALESLEQQLPDLPDYSDKIQNFIEQMNPDQLHIAFFPQGMDTPEKVREGVKSIYAIVRMREPIQTEAAAPNMQAVTQARQGVMDPGASDYAAKINAAILNG